MSVKFHGVQSSPRNLNGGGPQGATFGILEYLSQSSDNANCVDPSERFKFIDDLSILEIINLITIGLTSANIKASVPSDIPTHNQFIPGYIDTISEWTKKQKMELNEDKTKVMIFNFTNKYKFTTRLKVNNQNLEVIQKTKLLGTIIEDDLKWDQNTEYLTKKANTRLQILRKAKNFKASIEDLKQIYISFIRSILEFSCPVWHSSLTLENTEDLERIQKSALKIILQDKFKNYTNALNVINLESLKDRRKDICLSFAKNFSKNEKNKLMFQLKVKTHPMKLRNSEIFQVTHTNTERLKHSSIPYMQHLLNENKG